MPTINIIDMQGKVVGQCELSDKVFGEPLNEFVVTDCVVAELANRRQGTHSTKTRSTVSGGGKKPWRQKGTGRARTGSNRNPLWRHGAVIHGPEPVRDYTIRVPKKVRDLARRVVLSDKLREGRLVIVDQIRLDGVKTKAMASFIDRVAPQDEKLRNKARKEKLAGGEPLDSKRLVVTAQADRSVYLSGRNIPKVRVKPSNSISVFDLVNADRVILSRDAVAKIEEVLG